MNEPDEIAVTGCIACPFDDENAHCNHPQAPSIGGRLDTMPARVEHCDDSTWTPDGCPLIAAPALVMLRRTR